MRWLIDPTTKSPSVTLTAAVVSLLIVLGKLLLAGVVVAGVSCGTMDGGLAAAVLAPTWGAYVARRWGDSKPDVPVVPPAQPPPSEPSP
jgi:hypothetical protein